MTPETQGDEEKGPNGLPFINDPGNEDPGSLLDEEPEALPDDPDIAGEDGARTPG